MRSDRRPRNTGKLLHSLYEALAAFMYGMGRGARFGTVCIFTSLFLTKRISDVSDDTPYESSAQAQPGLLTFMAYNLAKYDGQFMCAATCCTFFLVSWPRRAWSLALTNNVPCRVKLYHVRLEVLLACRWTANIIHGFAARCQGSPRVYD